MIRNVNVGDRVGYIGNGRIQLGTVASLEFDQDDGEAKAFTVTWDDGLDDEGYWNTSDESVLPVGVS